ncbi:leptin receptor gene-related protein-like [Rhopilema esculentum]|uniref:leptin receptor gene-related protein-like n=1 Tax=Rhopilema esculentum TaxID=499914 RepID=UPI0031DD29A8
MGIVSAILCMSLTATIGILMLVLSCAYSGFQTAKGSCWILFIVLFYILVPVPVIILQRLKMILSAVTKDENFAGWVNQHKHAILEADFVVHCLLFFTSGMIISSFAFPVIMARAQVIQWGAVGTVVVGNIFIFGTMAAFLKRIDEWEHTVLHLNVDLKMYPNGRSAIFAMFKDIVKQKTDNRKASTTTV